MHEANRRLTALLAQVERGEEIAITRNGVAVAFLVGIKQKINRQPGLLAGQPGWKDFAYHPTQFAPMTDEQMRDEGWE